ncbi:sulfite exporter TauE/SafE family protein [Methylomagnum sp.]
MTLVIALALVIGLLLGLLGGGGSILTVPVLVYLVGLDPKTAIATSLVVVGATSVIAVIGHARGGRVCWKTGYVFGLAGMAGAYGGGRLAAFLPGHVLLLLFALVMLGTATAMLKGRKEEAGQRSGPICPRKLNMPAVLFDGLLVGALNGLVGVGGGFVIVPALNLLGGLPMHAAVGTSLLVIAMNSMAALAGYSSHVSIDLHLVGIVTGAAVAGSLVGGLFSKRLSGNVLRRGFGVFVIAIAGYLLHRELSWEVFKEIQRLVLEHRDFFWGLLTAAAVLLLYWLRGMIHHQDSLRGQPH